MDFGKFIWNHEFILGAVNEGGPPNLQLQTYIDFGGRNQRPTKRRFFERYAYAWIKTRANKKGIFLGSCIPQKETTEVSVAHIDDATCWQLF